MKINKHIKILDYPEYASISYTVSRINLSQQKGKEDEYKYALTQDKELIGKIAKFEQVKEENILITAGADVAMHHVAETFLDEGKIGIIPLPTFGRFEFHTKVVGAKVIFVKHTKFPYSFDLAKITRVAKDKKADMIFLANPNNPTGSLIDIKELSKFIEENNCLVVIDEALIEDTEDSVGKFINQYKNLVVIKSFSKLFAVPGLRIGYILANRGLIKTIGKTVSPYEVSSLSLQAIKRTPIDRKYSQEAIKEVKEARGFLIKHMPLPMSNTHGSVALILGKNNVSLFDYLLKYGILTVDGKNFRGLEKANSVRIVISNRKEIKKFISIVEKY